MTPSKRIRFAAVISVLLAVAVAVFLRCGTQRTAETPRVTEPPPATPAAKARTVWQPRNARPVQAREVDPPKQPLIEEVLTDRTEACVGEPAVISVRLRPDVRPPTRISINGISGNPVPVVSSVPEPREVLVRVRGADGVEDARIVQLDIRDCNNLFQYVDVSAERKSGSSVEDAYRFVAQPFFAREHCQMDGGREAWLRCNSVVPEGSERYQYKWDFGDGATAITDRGYVEHDYAGREETDVESRYLVKVEVTSRTEGSILGYVPLAISNGSFENKLLSGTITPNADMRCDLWSPGQKVACDVTFRNRDAATVTLNDVDVSVEACAGGSKSFDRPARRLLSTSVLPHGITRAKMELEPRDLGDEPCVLALTAQGMAPGNLRAQVVWGARVGGAVKLDPATLAKNPELADKLARAQKAMQLLGRDPAQGATVTDDEMRQLELQGLLPAPTPAPGTSR